MRGATGVEPESRGWDEEGAIVLPNVSAKTHPFSAQVCALESQRHPAVRPRHLPLPADVGKPLAHIRLREHVAGPLSLEQCHDGAPGMSTANRCIACAAAHLNLLLSPSVTVSQAQAAPLEKGISMASNLFVFVWAQGGCLMRKARTMHSSRPCSTIMI